MADPTLKGLAYSNAALKDIKKLFDQIWFELNNNDDPVDKIFSLAQRGADQASVAIKDLKYTDDVITITIEKGDVTTIHGCPPNVVIKIDNKDLKQISGDMKLIN